MLSTRVLRPPAPGDVEIVRALEAAAAATTGTSRSAPFVWRDLAAPSPESIGILAVDGRRSRVGYAHLAPSDTLADPHLVAATRRRPRPSRRTARSRRALLGCARAARPRPRPGPRVVLWVNGADDEFDALAVHAPASSGSASSSRCASRCPLAESPDVAARHHGPQLRPRRRRRRLAPGEQPRVREPPGPGRLGRGHAAAADRPSRGSTPTGFLLAFDADGLAGFCWTKVHDAEPDGPARRDLRDRRRPGPSGHRTRPRADRRRARAPAPATGTARPGCSTSTARTRPRSASTARSASTCTAPTAPTTLTPRTRRDHPLRRRPEDELAALDRSRRARRATASTRSSTRSTGSASRSKTRRRSPRRCAPRSRDAFPLALDPVVESTGDDGQTVKWLWQLPERRRRRSRPS